MIDTVKIICKYILRIRHVRALTWPFLACLLDVNPRRLFTFQQVSGGPATRDKQARPPDTSPTIDGLLDNDGEARSV